MSLTEDIMDFAKIEVGYFTLNEKPFKIATLIEEICFIFDYQWKQKGLYLRVEWDERTREIMFNSDIDRIKQILMNLISNAYKFTNEGGITLEIEVQQSREIFLESRYLCITVSDTGLGISESDKKGLFQVFGTVSKHRDQFNMKGTGLGLTITQKFVKLLGGQIELNSEENKGTEIKFTIKEKEMSHYFDPGNFKVIRKKSKRNFHQFQNINVSFLYTLNSVYLLI